MTDLYGDELESSSNDMIMHDQEVCALSHIGESLEERI